MSMNWKDRWSIGATMVADAFIDEYMAGANGEYVKVYLYKTSPIRLSLETSFIYTFFICPIKSSVPSHIVFI